MDTLKKMQVLIVEDEPPIGRYIRKLIEEIPGFEVVSICYCGEAALELMCKNRVDVLFTDIQMPGISGLGLIRKAREYNKELLCVVISGYKMFEYAKEAIELETMAYILKPVDAAELRRVCLTMQEQYRKRSRSAGQEALQIAFRKKDEETFQKLILGEGDKLLAVYYGDNQEEILRLVSGMTPDIYWFGYKKWLFFLCGEEGGQPEIISRKILFRPECRRTCACIAASGFGTSTEPMVELLRRWQRETLEKLVVPGKRVQLSMEGITFVEKEELLDGGLKNALNMDIAAGDRKKFERDFQALYGFWEKHQASISHIRKGMHELTESLQRNHLLNTAGIVCNEETDEIIWSGDSYQEIGEGLWKALEDFFEESLSENDVPRTEWKVLFEKILNFIEQNPECNYSLQEICDKFHVSQPYVRKIFRHYTGKTYKEYLLAWKVRTAKELMERNPSLLVKDVADKIGFEQLYFGSVFQRYTGMTPSRYKTNLQKEKESMEE